MADSTIRTGEGRTLEGGAALLIPMRAGARLVFAWSDLVIAGGTWRFAEASFDFAEVFGVFAEGSLFLAKASWKSESIDLVFREASQKTSFGRCSLGAVV